MERTFWCNNITSHYCSGFVCSLLAVEMDLETEFECENERNPRVKMVYVCIYIQRRGYYQSTFLQFFTISFLLLFPHPYIPSVLPG